MTEKTCVLVLPKLSITIKAVTCAQMEEMHKLSHDTYSVLI